MIFFPTFFFYPSRRLSKKIKIQLSVLTPESGEEKKEASNGWKAETREICRKGKNGVLAAS